MTSTQHTQPARTVTLDELTLSSSPVVLGGPSLRRRSGEARPPSRSAVRAPAGSPSLHPTDRDRLSTPR